MGSKSRRKGQRGEREWAAFLSDMGLEARRGVQYHGGPDAPDVICPVLDAAGFHVEVKRVEAFRLYESLEQAVMDACGKVPVVAHRQNGRPWIVVMPAAAFVRLIRDPPMREKAPDPSILPGKP